MRIDDKIKEIEIYLAEFSEIIPSSFEEYQQDIRTKAACERYFEKIVESAVDLAFLAIKKKNLKTPKDDKESFEVLSESRIISKELAKRMKDAKGMRNILAHQYGAVEDDLVYQSITEELIGDINSFIQCIKQYSG
jgi:uncharacterized protein YutE (UPF0331/DUF86 family)